jgi:hypothetical protein
MTHEELIDEGERWLRVMEDGEDLTQWVGEAVEALLLCKCSVIPEAATTNSELTVEYEYRRVSRAGRIYFATFESMPELNEGESVQRRILGPWEVVE